MTNTGNAQQREHRKSRMFGLAFHNFFKQKPQEAQALLSTLSPVFSSAGRTAVSERLNLPLSFDASPVVLAENRKNRTTSRSYAERLKPMNQEERARYEGKVFRAIGTAIIVYRSKNEDLGLRIYRGLIPYLEGGVESKDRERFAYLFDTPERVRPDAITEKPARRLDAVRVAAINKMIRVKEGQDSPDNPPADPSSPAVADIQPSFDPSALFSDFTTQKDPER
jgi:hypothetical protein